MAENTIQYILNDVVVDSSGNKLRCIENTSQYLLNLIHSAANNALAVYIDPSSDVMTRIAALEEENEYATYFTLTSSSSGTINATSIIGTSAIFIANYWADGVDALVSEIGSGSRPNWEPAYTAGGSEITVTGFTLGGDPTGTTADYTLSGTPTGNVALVFRYKQPREYVDYSKTIEATELVEDYASQAEAEAATISDKMMSPLTTQQFLNANDTDITVVSMATTWDHDERKVWMYNPSSSVVQALPTTDVKRGNIYHLYWSTTSSNPVTLEASGGSDICIGYGDGHAIVAALIDSPTSSTHWKVLDIYDELTISNQDWEFNDGAYDAACTSDVSFCRINNQVTVTVGNTYSTDVDADGYMVTTDGAGTVEYPIPADMRPSVDVYSAIRAREDGTYQSTSGMFVAMTSGALGAYKTWASGGFTSADTNPTGFSGTHVTWTI